MLVVLLSKLQIHLVEFQIRIITAKNLKAQITAEQQLLGFTSNNLENYNSHFILLEYNYAISRAKYTAPGPDGIYYRMLRSTPIKVNNHILTIINTFWSDSFYPDQWRHDYNANTWKRSL